MKISVVIPACNEEHVLPRCLDALNKQTRPADEVIVVDNNSRDGTAAIARQYGAKVIMEKKQGIMPAASTGYDAAISDIIARIDADTVVPADWLERIEDLFRHSPDTAAVTGPGRFYGTGRLAAAAAQGWYMQAYFVLVGSALAAWPLFGSNMALRRSAWMSIRTQVHRDRADIHDDMELSMHLPASARVRYIRSLAVGISARALKPAGLAGRYKKGYKTLAMHWPEQAPMRRWARVIAGWKSK